MLAEPQYGHFTPSGHRIARYQQREQTFGQIRAAEKLDRIAVFSRRTVGFDIGDIGDEIGQDIATAGNVRMGFTTMRQGRKPGRVVRMTFSWGAFTVCLAWASKRSRSSS